MKNALLATLLAMAVVLGVASPASAAPVKPQATRPSASFFGMHYSAFGQDDSYPETTAIGSVRLWDTGTTWADIQPKRDVWDWTVLDRAVEKARAHGDTVMYVMGRTPSWAARPQLGVGTFAVGDIYPPQSSEDWVAYVRAVARRYKGKINAYEVWNEMNISGYYGGTVEDMVRLTRLAYRTIKAVDPKAIVAAPSTTIRGNTGTRMQLKFAKLGGFRYADVVNVHLYPDVNGTPEDGARMLSTFRARIRKAGVTKPIWNSEMNYGLAHGLVLRKTPLTAGQQAAWVIRNFLLQWSSGAKRVYWYDWSTVSFLGIRMITPDGHSPSRAGAAFSIVREWMSGRMSRCTVARKTGTYSCLINYGHGNKGVVHWNPRHWVTVQAPRGTTSMSDYRGNKRVGKATKRVRVGQYPVLFAYTAQK